MYAPGKSQCAQIMSVHGLCNDSLYQLRVPCGKRLSLTKLMCCCMDSLSPIVGETNLITVGGVHINFSLGLHTKPIVVLVHARFNREEH